MTRPKYEIMSVRLTPSQAQKVKDASAVLKRSTSEILRMVIAEADLVALLRREEGVIELRESAPGAPPLPKVEPTAEDLREAARQCAALAEALMEEVEI